MGPRCIETIELYFELVHWEHDGRLRNTFSLMYSSRKQLFYCLNVSPLFLLIPK